MEKQIKKQQEEFDDLLKKIKTNSSRFTKLRNSSDMKLTYHPEKLIITPKEQSKTPINYKSRRKFDFI